MERHELIDLIASEIYEATMGDAAIVPWPGSNADNYRRIANRVIERLERENIFHDRLF